MAKLLDQTGRPAEAEKLLRACLAARRKKLGGQHPSVASALQELAATRLHQRDREEARRLLEEALAIRVRVQGPDHRESNAVRTTLASL